MTSREIVLAALSFEHPPRVPRQLWSLPWAADRAEALYRKGDVVTVGGDEYRIVAFKSTALKLHRPSDSAVYQLGVSSQGCVTYVKLLGHAN